MRRPVVAVAAVVALVASLALVACGDGGAPGAPRVEWAAGAAADWDYVIPAGTGERMDRGEPVDILPRRIDARVGEVIRIVNEDDRGHVLGPFYVGRHETSTQRFATAGEYRGACSVHPSGELVLVVHP